MSSVDDILKPHLARASSSNHQKRKFQPGSHIVSDPQKTPRLNSNGDVKSQRYRQPQLEDEADGEDDEQEAGPERPPDDDEQDEPDEDEEGRFFGGGVTKSANAALNYLDARAEDGDEPAQLNIDAAWVRRHVQSLDRRISKNSELRSKFEDEPAKFMASEADLDADVKACSTLTDYPGLYPDFVQTGGVQSLVNLLAHDNTDIAIDAMQVLAELTDEDVAAEQEQWDAMVETMLEADLIELLTSNWDRLDERDEADRNGVYHSLSLLENFASQTLIIDRVSANPKVFDWLLKRVQEGKQITQNKQYAAEILSIYVQASTTATTALIAKDAVDIILQRLAYYRKTDPPRGSDDEEFAENLFGTLTCLVDTALGKQKLLDAEGIELLLIMLAQTKFAKARALKVIDHAVSALTAPDIEPATAVAEHLVTAAGLKPLFAAFYATPDRASQAHLLGILAALLRFLPGASAPRIRTLAKFVEREYRAIARLCVLRKEYAARLAPVEKRIAAERAQAAAGADEDEDELEYDFLSRRFDAGLFSARTIDVVLAWLVAEDDGMRAQTVEVLGRDGKGLADVAATLGEVRDGLVEEGQDEGGGGLVGEERDMLSTLLELLE